MDALVRNHLGFLALLTLTILQAQTGPSPVVKKMASVKPEAIFQVGGNPDWMAVADDAVWVTSSRLNLVTQLVARNNAIGLKITVANPCSGLAAGFGSLWIPSCGDHSLVRADLKTGHVVANISAAPADSEGCIAVGGDSIWMATSASGIVSRIDPKSNSVIASIPVPSGSFCPVFADGFLWVTSTEHNLVSKISPAINRVIAKTSVGKHPRFASASAGSIWTLNQGDGTISRVDTATGKLVTNVAANLPGHGGEITFGFGAVWATLIGTPVTRIDAQNNRVVRQWTGAGGDSIRAGHGSIWLTNIKAGVVWRISPDRL